MCVREREAEVESCCSIFEIKAFASFLAIETEVLSFLALLQGNARVSLFYERGDVADNKERERERERAGEAGEREGEKKRCLPRKMRLPDDDDVESIKTISLYSP